MEKLDKIKYIKINNRTFSVHMFMLSCLTFLLSMLYWMLWFIINGVNSDVILSEFSNSVFASS